jgi:NhaA family Na+:H+ antiporter
MLIPKILQNEKTGGLLLIICTIISITIANSAYNEGYQHLLHFQIAGNGFSHWINDGLMALFFLFIGLELKFELLEGHLSKIKNAVLPVVAALGGMVVPILIYLIFNHNSPTMSGYGIPMATDIAFALGALSLLGSRVPVSIKVFLTALAVIDDLGAIVVIGLFYSTGINWIFLMLALATFGLLLFLKNKEINSIFVYIIGGIIMWYCMLHSGVHATISGVLLAFTIPVRAQRSKCLSSIMLKKLHQPVVFLILPLFAIANTAVVFESNIIQLLNNNYCLGIILGLIVGKPLGIFLFSYVAVKLNICKLPNRSNWNMIMSVGCLGGIGFTMSIFITLLAFNDMTIINNAKIAILLSSLIAAFIGLIGLKLSIKSTESESLADRSQ